MKLSNIDSKLSKAHKLRDKTESAYLSVLDVIIPYFDFELDDEHDTIRTFFHVEYQASDGIVVGDNYSNVYSMLEIINYIKENGSFKSLKELKRNCAI